MLAIAAPSVVTRAVILVVIKDANTVVAKLTPGSDDMDTTHPLTRLPRSCGRLYVGCRRAARAQQHRHTAARGLIPAEP